jgi:hypothetical protein
MFNVPLNIRKGTKSMISKDPNIITLNEPKGERVADGSVLAMSRGNARGAKGPCC